jgi:predicted AAA+ superfamily ATPase
MSNMEHAGDRGEKKELRREHPSGWIYLTQHDAIPILVDALLDPPPNREFNKTELAEHAGLTRQTVGDYTNLLLEVEVIEEVPSTSPRRYRVAESNVVGELLELNSALNNAGDE